MALEITKIVQHFLVVMHLQHLEGFQLYYPLISSGYLVVELNYVLAQFALYRLLRDVFNALSS